MSSAEELFVARNSAREASATAAGALDWLEHMQPLVDAAIGWELGRNTAAELRVAVKCYQRWLNARARA